VLQYLDMETHPASSGKDQPVSCYRCAGGTGHSIQKAHGH
jgi:hypothetical protein